MVLEFVGQLINPVFAPLTAFSPVLSIFIFSTMVTIVILVGNRLIINKSFVDEIRKRMEQLKESMTQAQKEGNKENVQKYMGELMHANNQYMTHSFRTLIISLIVIALFLPWLSYTYSTTAISIPFNLPFFGSSISWLYWYVLVSFSVGWAVRKIFGAVI